MKIIAKNKKHLQQLIKREIKLNGNNCDLNHIDVSDIEDMRFIFNDSQFNGDISNWNVSNVKYMEWMFNNSQLEKENNLPFWYLETQEERINAINKYKLKQKLEKDLINSKIEKRSKI